MASYSQFDGGKGTKYANMGKKKKKLDSTKGSRSYSTHNQEPKKPKSKGEYKGGLTGKLRHRQMQMKDI